ncbi:hypothetical protein Sjap_019750 [Stephania japonica]|uniref:Golgin candidate 6 n=1 Tax=Stephania japonica TaxID=461633 RepID=A0AAP0HZN3_9MAGN
MDFKLGRLNLNAVAQGVGGLVFGNENSSASEDSYVERLLDRISNGVLAEDRRAALTELQSVVAESHSAQLAFGAMGFPVLLGVLKEERDDVDMIRGSLETLVSALTPVDQNQALKSGVQPALMNSDLLSREAESISLLLSMLEEEDFYVRYYTLQLLTALLTHSQNRLQEAILSTPRGITRLIDMLMDREVIRNEALLLLTHLSREAEEIKKILVFEGAFEKIFSIIKEEGGSDGGVVVQDCLELLSNLLRKTPSNQILLRETVGFESLISILKLRSSSYSFTKQKTVNLLGALEIIELLLTGGLDAEPGADSNRIANQTVLAQKRVLDCLLFLGVESQWVAVSVRCLALRCTGCLVARHSQNLDALASKVIGEEPHAEPALNSILHIILRTSSIHEFLAADYVFKSFCEKNPDGQSLLASTIISQPLSVTHTSPEEDFKIPFGSMLLKGLTVNENEGDLEICCRAASVLSYILQDNIHCKERVLKVAIEATMPSLGVPEPLLHRIVKYLALATSLRSKNADSKSPSPAGGSNIQPIILRLLVIWLADCPNAVQSFLDSRPNLTYLLELVSSKAETVWVRGLSAVILGQCVLFNKAREGNTDAFMVVDAISQKIGLTSYFLKFDEMRKSFPFISSKPPQYHKPLERSNAASTTEIEDANEHDETSQKHDEDPVVMSVFDGQFISLINRLETDIRESIVDTFSHTKSKVTVIPAELEQKSGEKNEDYIKRLKAFVEKQCREMQDLLGRNATLAEDLAKTGGSSEPGTDQRAIGSRERVQTETLTSDLHEAMQRIEMLKSEKAKIEAEASMYRNVAGKMESDLQSLSDAYNSLEQVNYRLESEVKALRNGGSELHLDIEAIKSEAREEAQKESEAELNDLLVCLGQEQSKVEKLSAKLEELGEDVDALLEGIGDDAALPEDGRDEEDD